MNGTPRGTPLVLGLDVGGANLKAAAATGRAASRPFALWKEPGRLPAALADFVAQFPDATEFAVAMTGELCDCYETKRQGVNAILDAVEGAAAGKPVRVWSVVEGFVSAARARADHMAVAASNWHALATFAGRYAPHGGALLVDVGSTTSDLIPLRDGVPATRGRNDADRLRFGELVYAGVRRTPVCAVLPEGTAAELFATTRDVYLTLGRLPERPDDRDTADGRPATVPFALARLARMLGADREMLSDGEIVRLARRADDALLDRLTAAARRAYLDAQRPPELRTAIVSGEGEFLARRAVERAFPDGPTERVVSLDAELGPAASACAPAHALAVLGTERRP